MQRLPRAAIAGIAFFLGVILGGIVLITLGSSGSRTTCLDAAGTKGVYATRIASASQPCTKGQRCIHQDPAVGADELAVTDCR